jgi:hypothetical protein
LIVRNQNDCAAGSVKLFEQIQKIIAGA